MITLMMEINMEVETESIQDANSADCACMWYMRLRHRRCHSSTMRVLFFFKEKGQLY